MLCYRRVLIAFLCLASIVVVAAITRADTLDYPFSIGGSGVSVPKFDPSLGTLQAVTLSTEVEGDFRVAYQNWNPVTGGLVMICGDFNWRLNAPDSLNLMGVCPSRPSGYVTAFGGGNDTFLFVGRPFDTKSLTIDISDPYFVRYDYVGLGEVMISGSGELSTWPPNTFGSDPDLDLAFVAGGSFRGLAMFDGDLTYTYQPAPEPTTLAHLSVAAITVLAYVWRRRKHVP